MLLMLKTSYSSQQILSILFHIYIYKYNNEQSSSYIISYFIYIPPMIPRSHMIQQISIALQRGNAASVLGNAASVLGNAASVLGNAASVLGNVASVLGTFPI